MDRSDYLTHLEADGRAFIEACQAVPAAPVAACPEWTNTELLGHLAMVWRFALAQVTAADASNPTGPDIPEGDTPAAALTDVLAAFAEVDLAAPAWNWSPNLTAAFWVRRMAHETAVHRWDAQQAAGTPQPIDPVLASDTLAEVVEVMAQFHRKGKVEDFPAGSLHLHGTDADAEWLLVPGPEGLVVTQEHAKADVAAKGTTSNLALWLWGRGQGDLTCFGDQDLLDAWASVTP
ncbi:MAG: maleylpyruvate isomerase family mycothiol-dependent enzyme [Acidimicrobiales bacterium]|nr:maleylpyruvate isomerase family mycothiol-dependent enzyme [Acidimicrobiales bacterium]